MARPNWEWIKVDVLLPEHPKVEGLSDKAFRALIELWCYCGRQHTDGLVSARQWQKWPPRVRDELVAAGLADLGADAGVTMHDFTGERDGHQRSRDEIEELSAKRSDSGKKAAAARWNGHVKSHALRIPKRMRFGCGKPKVKDWFGLWSRTGKIASARALLSCKREHCSTARSPQRWPCGKHGSRRQPRYDLYQNACGAHARRICDSDARGRGIYAHARDRCKHPSPIWTQLLI